MKIAVCLSGQPRRFNMAYPSIYQHLLSKHNPDIFLHSWFDPAMVGKPFDCAHWNKRTVDCVQHNTDKKLVSLYSPKKYLIETPKDFQIDVKKYEARKAGVPTHIVFSMWYSIQQADLLRREYEKETGTQYDCVVRCRYDLNFFGDINFEKYNLAIMHGAAPKMAWGPNVLYDHFAFSNSHNMLIYSDLYPNIDRYFTEDNVKLCNESMLGHHMLKNKIKVSNRLMPYNILKHNININTHTCRRYIL